MLVITDACLRPSWQVMTFSWAPAAGDHGIVSSAGPARLPLIVLLLKLGVSRRATAYLYSHLLLLMVVLHLTENINAAFFFVLWMFVQYIQQLWLVNQGRENSNFVEDLFVALWRTSIFGIIFELCFILAMKVLYLEALVQTNLMNLSCTEYVYIPFFMFDLCISIKIWQYIYIYIRTFNTNVGRRLPLILMCLTSLVGTARLSSVLATYAGYLSP